MKMNLLLSIIVASQMAWTITATSCTSHIRLSLGKGRKREILTNENGTVPFPLLTKYSTTQPENLIGLMYVNPKTKRETSVNCDENFCYPPHEPCLWPDYTYMLEMSASWSAPMECLSVKVAKKEGGEEFDITPHPNGAVDLQQIAIALNVPEVDGLKFRIHETDTWKNVLCTEKMCHPPRPTEPRGRTYGAWETDCTWGTQTYIMMVKRKKTIEDYDLEGRVKILEGVAKSSVDFGEGIMHKVKDLGEKIVIAIARLL